nr:molybdopterin-dependent oxidoreductase [Hankyongella ginsenosidimutans]
MRNDAAAVLGAAHSLADKCAMVRDGWNGFNVLHTAAGRVGALDIGFAAEGGMAKIAADAASGALKAVFLHGVDEADLSAFADVFTVYIGSHGDAGVRTADVILPAAAYTEKSATYVNTEGRVQRTLKATFAPGDAREDWTILRALSDVLACTLPYDSLGALRQRIAGEWPHLADVGVIAPSAWAGFGATGDIAPGAIALPIKDFYQTNPIARASATMAECARTIVGEADEKATGTHG